MTDPRKFLEDRTGRYAKHYADALSDMLAAELMGSSAAYMDARDRFSEATRETMGMSTIVGASTVLRDAAGALTAEGFRSPRERTHLAQFKDAATQSILPSVTFEEALTDLVNRVPVTLKDAAERTASNIAKLYGPGQQNIAFVRSAEDAVTKKAHSVIAQAVRDGVSENEAGRRISMAVDEVRQVSGEWSESYSRLCFRNNVNTAVMQGRREQWRDPDIAAVVPCVMFVTAGDIDVRSNHRPANGKVFKPDAPD